jgi:multicomponent Na+:H+ antiporter subunit B
MSDSVRLVMVLVSGVILFVLLCRGFFRLPPFGVYEGPYGDLVMRDVVQQRHTEQGVGAITFDYRGFDTLGEECILFASVAGVLLLMRRMKEEKEVSPHDLAEDRSVRHSNEALLMLGTLLFPITLTTAVYVVLHGHLSPGGGFQGGVLAATGFLFVYLSGDYRDFSRLLPDHLLDMLESAGVGAFVLTAVAGVLAGGYVLQNILPLGETGKLLSGGTLPLLNIVAGLAVAAGILAILSAFLRQALQVRMGRRKE